MNDKQTRIQRMVTGKQVIRTSAVHRKTACYGNTLGSNKQIFLTLAIEANSAAMAISIVEFARQQS